MEGKGGELAAALMRNAGGRITQFRRAGGVYKLTMWVPKQENGIRTKRWGRSGETKKKKKKK